MNSIRLSADFLNSNKIVFHYGKLLEDIYKEGKKDFNPIAIEVHPTAMCNHRCIHCSYKERNESRNSLSKEVMDKLMDSIINMKIKAVYFSGGGEPTLYPNLKEYINKLYSNNVECSIITNGSYFEESGIVNIANKLNYIAVSVPAVTEDTFKLITGTDNMKKVLGLPKRIKDIHGDNSPVIGSRIVITNKNYKDVGEFLRIIKESCFDYALFKIVRDYEDNGQGLSKDEELYLKEQISKYKNFDEDFTNIKSIFNYRKPIEFKNKCWVNYYSMIANVGTDGKVYPNIVEIDKPEFCIGDLNTSALEEMWNSDVHNKVKEASNQKWLEGKCKNCRAMSYNNIINNMVESIPSQFDPFI
ncbi:MAG: radical SAM protein [Lachnospiraceae bacterium]|nr:radical SAM protein [Lachnospiraceae bacterium]